MSWILTAQVQPRGMAMRSAMLIRMAHRGQLRLLRGLVTSLATLRPSSERPRRRRRKRVWPAVWPEVLRISVTSCRDL